MKFSSEVRPARRNGDALIYFLIGVASTGLLLLPLVLVMAGVETRYRSELRDRWIGCLNRESERLQQYEDTTAQAYPVCEGDFSAEDVFPVSRPADFSFFDHGNGSIVEIYRVPGASLLGKGHQ